MVEGDVLSTADAHTVDGNCALWTTVPGVRPDGHMVDDALGTIRAEVAPADGTTDEDYAPGELALAGCDEA